MTPDFDIHHFVPSEPGWLYATLLEKDTWDVYPLLGWAEITVKRTILSDEFRTVVPVPVGAQGEGALAVMYEPSERLRINHGPALFKLLQASGDSLVMTTAELREALAQEAING